MKEHKKNRKFGSSYDPSHQETVKRVIVDGNPSLDADYISKMVRELRPPYLDGFSDRYFSNAFGEGIRVGSSESGGLPLAYKEARRAVEDWIVDAPEQSFDDIVGNEECLSQIRDAIEAPVKHKDLFESYGMPMPKGALLFGPPGCGKTMFGRAAACAMSQLYGGGVEFLSIAASSLQSGYVGATEQRIISIFSFAREYKRFHGHPLLVFIDEAEALLPDRNSSVRHTTWFEQNQVATFLSEMDGVKENGAFILLATNRPDALDQAVLRDGRCDFKVEVLPPNREAVEQILRNRFEDQPVFETTINELVFSAIECLYDPMRIIKEAATIKVALTEKGPDVSISNHHHFCLEHIISGAMAASIPNRAKRFAFARDKRSGIMTGITVEDVVSAVSALFEENKGLDHNYSLKKFIESLEH